MSPTKTKQPKRRSDARSDMDRVQSYLEKNRPRFVAELCEYLRFPSVSAGGGDAKQLARCAGWLVKHCREIGLKTELYRTAGNPVIVARTPRNGGRRKPHYVVYGHYDVQPPEPLELWKSPPFEPRMVGSSLFARGASDDKGQHFAHLKGVEAYLKTGTPLPCDLTFIIEGEEEVSSPSLAPFLRQHRSELRCDSVVISDGTLHGLNHPTLAYGLRGVCGLEVILHGPSRDLHSGLYGGSIENPAMALCQLLAGLRDRNGRITIPGFYDDVIPLSAFERRQFASEPFDEREEKKQLGVPSFFGEAGYTAIERRTARPTLEINGLTAGFQGPGGKTIIPSWARAKLTMRLVPGQEPGKTLARAIAHLKKICPPTVRLEIIREHGGPPYMVSSKSAHVQAALEALRVSFGREPLLVREGGSIPIVNDFKRILGADTLLLGLGLPDDNIHSPNEKFSLVAFAKGMLMSAWLWQKLPDANRP